MSLETDILNALMTKLTTPALSSPATPIASPLVTYTPTSGTPYLHAHPVMRAEPEAVGIAFTAKHVDRGIFQVDAVVPIDAGESVGLRLAALVRARFPLGTSLVAGSYRLQILQRPTIATAVEDAPWVRYPVSIPYTIVN